MLNRLTLAMAAAVIVLAPSGASGQGYICAEGGGSIGRADWVSPVFAWMVERAERLAAQEAGAAGEADVGVVVVVLGSRDGPPEPDEPDAQRDQTSERFRHAGAAEVRNLWIDPGNADSPEVYKAISTAHAVWMRGGSQTRYVNWWKGTGTQRAIREVFARGGVVGGTSAGCAVLGEIVYDAQGGSCASRDALRDSHTHRISFTTGFLDLAPGVLFDSHFTERGRIGRLAVMLARVKQDMGREVLGIGMDTRTALCIDPDGTAEVIGSGTASFLSFGPAGGAALTPGRPPSVWGLELAQIVSGQKYDLKTRRIFEPAAVDRADPAPAKRAVPPFPGIVIDGGEPGDSRRGEWSIEDGGDATALTHGRVAIREGTGELPGLIVQTGAFDVADRAENRVGGMIWGLAHQPNATGTLVSAGARVRFEAPRTVRVIPTTPGAGPGAGGAGDGEGKGGATLSDISVVVIDGVSDRTATSPHRWSASSLGPRQAVGFRSGRVAVLAPGWGISLDSGRVHRPDGE